jgi:hypothetical protein
MFGVTNRFGALVVILGNEVGRARKQTGRDCAGTTAHTIAAYRSVSYCGCAE